MAMYHLKVLKNMFLCLRSSDPYMQGSDRCDTKKLRLRTLIIALSIHTVTSLPYQQAHTTLLSSFLVLLAALGTKKDLGAQ